MTSIVQIRPAISVGRTVHKFGYNPDVDASTGPDEDIIGTGGSSYLPETATAAASINISSSDAEDDPVKADTNPGTGAHQIMIEGLDADYREQSEVVTLNGTANVNPVNDYLRIHRAYAQAVGTTGTNVGAITIADGTGTFATILAGFGETTRAMYTVPANYSAGWLLDFDATLADTQSQYAEGILQYRCNCNSAWRTFHVFNVTSDGYYEHQYRMPLKLEPLSDIRLRIFNAGADNLPIAGSFTIYLEP